MTALESPNQRLPKPEKKGWAAKFDSMRIVCLTFLGVGCLLNLISVVSGNGINWFWMIVIFASLVLWGLFDLVSDYLHNRATVVGITGQRYPKFEVFRYINPNHYPRLSSMEWENRGVTGMLKGDRRDPMTGIVFTCCPLSALLSLSQMIPSGYHIGSKIIDEYPSWNDGASLPIDAKTLYRLIDEFFEASDSGKILPMDLPIVVQESMARGRP